MDLVNQSLTSLREDLAYVREEKYKIFSYGCVDVYKSNVHSTRNGKYIGEYIVVALPSSSDPEVISELTAFERATSHDFNWPIMLTGIDAFTQGEEICFRYELCYGDLDKFVQTQGFQKEVFRDLFRAIHCMHYEQDILHGNLKSIHNIMVIAQENESKDTKFAIRLMGFKKVDRTSESDARNECCDLANILDRLRMPKPPPYFQTLLTHIRTAGCYNLHEAYFLLDVKEKCTYLDIAFREVRENKLKQDLSDWYPLNNVEEPPNWQSDCETHKHLGPLYDYDKKSSSYGAGGYQFLRFSRNVSLHREKASLAEEELMQELYDVWPEFFNWLPMFFEKFQIPIFTLQNEKYA
ncbi:hypothetical protein LINGRAHAP2_LOCUS26824 [Linum grandiflorum]